MPTTPPLGVVSIGLNVFGPNVAARRLYEDLGYQVTSTQMRLTI